MSYLFSQIAVSLLLAGILGAAIGWLAHRASAGKQISSLRQIVGQQQQHVSEAHTEVSMIEADFDDLKHNTDLQISELRLENEKIPALNQNLEKSQLLVRQLLQKHKAEFDELSIENEKLSASTKLAADREMTINKLQAQLDSQKTAAAQSADAQSSGTESKTNTQGKTNTQDHTNKQGTSNATSKTGSLQATDAGKGSLVAASLGTSQRSGIAASGVSSSNTAATNNTAKSTDAKASNTATDKAETKLNAEAAQKISEERATEHTSKVDASAATEGVSSTLSASAKSSELTSEQSSTKNQQSNKNQQNNNSELVGDQQAKRLPLSANLFSASALSKSVTLSDVADTENELEDLRAQLSSDDVTEPESVTTKTQILDAEAEEKDTELEQLFDSVDHQDDLKQIFGIGPVTEKTLNKLGITSYSQLAELKQHDIEKIADALQIFPGRIERDNWVGSARTQLEEVLEEL